MNLSKNSKIFLSLILIIYSISIILFIDKRITVDEIWHSVPAFNLLDNKGPVVSAILENDKPHTLYHLFFFEVFLFLWSQVAGMSPVILRIPGTFLGFITIILTFLIGRRILKKDNFALFSAALVAFDNILFISASSVRTDIYMSFAICFLVYFVFNDQNEIIKKRLLPAGIFSIIFMGIHPNFIIIFIALNFFLYLSIRSQAENRKTFKHVLNYSAPLILLIIFLILFSFYYLRNADYTIIDIFFSYLKKATMLNSDLVSKIFGMEWNRYLDFIQFPYRIHFFVLMIAAIISGLVSKDKNIFHISIMILIILFLFMIILRVKVVRYFVIVIPFISILSSGLFQSYYRKYLMNRNRLNIKILFMIMLIFLLSALTGNGLLIQRHWNTSYGKLKESIYFKHEKGDVIVGPLILWDIFKESEYISLNSLRYDLKKTLPDYIIYNDIESINQEFIITKGNTFSNRDFVMKKQKNFWSIFGKSINNAEILKEFKNSYYGNLRVYKINLGNKDRDK